MALIFVEVVPESVSLPVLQHQICNFQICNFQIWNVSHRNYSCAFTTSYHVSHYPVYPEITKITSAIDAKTEPHEGRNMASVDLHA